MSNNSKIRFVVVGAGHIGKRHAEMIRRDSEGELVAMVDIRSQKECAAEDFNVPFFTTMEELFASELEFDVVNICTPNGLHAEQSLKALSEKKNVVCEKPMGLTKESCERILFKALQESKQVFCVMQNRYSPPSEWIKSVITDGLLGEIYMVQLNCYWNRDDRYYKSGGWKGTADLDGGTLFTQFADFNHQTTTAFEDSGFVSFDFMSGGMGSINYSTSIANQNLESSMTIIGKNGSVKIGGQYMNEVEVCTISGYEMPVLKESNPANDYGPYKGSAANHNYIISNVIDTLKGRTSPTTNALEGMKVVDIIERIYKVRDKNK